jgi:hypothetical protein
LLALKFVLPDIATIASISYLFRSTGSVIGVSLVSTVFQSKLKQYLEQSITGPDAQNVRLFLCKNQRTPSGL